MIISALKKADGTLQNQNPDFSLGYFDGVFRDVLYADNIRREFEKYENCEFLVHFSRSNYENEIVVVAMNTGQDPELRRLWEFYCAIITLSDERKKEWTGLIKDAVNKTNKECMGALLKDVYFASREESNVFRGYNSDGVQVSERIQRNERSVTVSDDSLLSDLRARDEPDPKGISGVEGINVGVRFETEHFEAPMVEQDFPCKRVVSVNSGDTVMHVSSEKNKASIGLLKTEVDGVIKRLNKKKKMLILKGKDYSEAIPDALLSVLQHEISYYKLKDSVDHEMIDSAIYYLKLLQEKIHGVDVEIPAADLKYTLERLCRFAEIFRIVQSDKVFRDIDVPKEEVDRFIESFLIGVIVSDLEKRLKQCFNVSVEYD
ncbi:MAG: hypothetical protein HQL51_03435 [Magnetococcales bacterium]|nr:hypothetical protein [Magnetococcales bacterium]